MQPIRLQADIDAQRRRSVRRTVFVMAAIAFLIYGGFIASGVIGR